MSALSPELLGEVFSDAKPAEDPVLFGYADLEPKGAFEARSFQTFRLTYVTGRYGLDDTGSIRIVFRFTADGGALQMTDPAASNYVTATSSSGVPLRLAFDENGHQRPWYQALTVSVSKGYLREGDRIEVVLGDRSGGSPGLRLQSFCESAFSFKVLADVCATGHFIPVTESPTIAIVPGPPAVWKAVLPTLRRPGETFRLSIKAEDKYGNPSDKVDAALALTSERQINGLPETVNFKPGERALVIDGLSSDQEGDFAVDVRAVDGGLLARTNPLVIRDAPVAAYWADMHGQSGESIGINTAREYFTFARDYSFLDATSHQANDFQINNAFWALVNELTAEFHEDGRFLTLPGYEWSGNTGVGGDRNVYFRNEGRAIRRSSHALVSDRSDIATDAPTARELFDALQDEDCLIYAHIGGRPADVAFAHDARLETAMEIHSAWGTFEWLMEDCFKLGHRVGVVANSDGHKGRPGASYPGASKFGAYGGLTCFLMEELTRDSLFDCLKRRRHYATTGDRLHIDLTVESGEPFQVYDIDPKVEAGPSRSVSKLEMGDIAATTNNTATLSFNVAARAPIERIDVLNGMDHITTIRHDADGATGERVRVLWRGAQVKGRGARAHWIGCARFRNCAIRSTKEINAWNPDFALQREDEATLSWESVTAGNFGAFDVWLDEGEGARLDLKTNLVDATVDLASIGRDDHIIDAGGLDLAIHVFRLPTVLDPRPLSASVEVPLRDQGDNPLWIRVTTEDGFQAWTSPVYLFRDDAVG